VLIVDDEPHVCELINDGLTERGFACTAMSQPRQAKQLLSHTAFDVLVADIIMPDMDGLQLLEFARAHRPACKVILITALSNTDNLTRALWLGAYDYLQKPFELEKLADTVSRAAEETGQWSHLAARAARTIQMESEFRVASLQSVRALVDAVEAKDPYTRRHSEQVTHYALHVAQCIKIPALQMESIHIAALLHDIGKIGVPDHILTKPSRLTEDEFTQIRRHPALGADILQNISMFAGEARLVRHHHEKWDGTGYPDSLAGDAIPLGSRIINVADSIDAMLMQRTYKGPYPVAKMLAELERCSARQFDPQIADAAANWCRQNPDSLILPA
jgi:putative nucleotidyltransferase with HDIG domain